MNTTADTQFTSPVRTNSSYNNRMQWVTEEIIVVGRSAKSTGPRWIFVKRNGRITVRKIKGAFARVVVLEPTRRITVRELADQFPTVQF